MGIKENFTENLIKIRKSLGYTQEKLGELLDFDSADTISRYETGKNFPSPEKLEKIVKTLNLTYDELLNKNDETLKDQNTLKLLEIEAKTLSDDEQKLILELTRAYKAHLKVIKLESA